MKNKVAIYCRLSREDGYDESHSILEQKDALIKYVDSHGWSVYDVYIDDGYSGTNFDRPNFKRMINDIENKKIDIVLTKDLSRLGRNYIYTGYYIEDYFPIHNVRYIAVNDNYDSSNNEDEFTPFKNIINEWYAKDISKKVRFTLDNKAKNGDPRNTVYPIFGYKYNEKYERIIDPETAPIVKLIFAEYLKCGSAAKVATILKSKKIKLPMYYNAIKYNYNKTKVLGLTEDDLTKWNARKVRDILKKEEYIGSYITAKSKTLSYKIKKRDRNNSNAYIYKERYASIISKEDFYKVKNMLSVGRSGTVTNDENPFKNILICGKCDQSLRLNRWKNKDGITQNKYVCRNKNCSCKGVIYQDKLKLIIENELKKVFLYIRNNKEFIIKKIKEKNENNCNSNYNDEKRWYIDRCNKIDLLIQKLYEEKIINNMSNEVYKILIDKYVREKQSLTNAYNYSSNKNEKKIVDEIKLKRLIDEIENLNLNGEIINNIIVNIKVRKENKNIFIKIYYYKLENEGEDDDVECSDICETI